MAKKKPPSLRHGATVTWKGNKYKILGVYSIYGKNWYMIHKEKLLVEASELTYEQPENIEPNEPAKKAKTKEKKGDRKKTTVGGLPKTESGLPDPKKEEAGQYSLF